jgi:hypothetical protein
MRPLRRVLVALLLGVALVGCAGLCPSPGGDSAARILELNRAGEWRRAARMARRFLDADPAPALGERCEATWGLAYANARLGDSGAAGEALDLFDRQCGDLPTEAWVWREIENLRAELEPTGEGRRGGSNDDGFWQVADGPSLGLDANALAFHLGLCKRTGADACLVVYRGRIVQEWYSPHYPVPIYAMSSTKSVTGLLTGMLVDDGKIESLDVPVCAYIPDWCAGEKGRVTLRHLLSMTSGLKGRSRKGDSVGYVADKNSYVIGLPLSWEPGTRWSYSNEGVQLLSPILDRAAGERIQDYARRRLFEPLGMMDTRLHADVAGHAWTYADMETTPRDLARLGVLMLNRGRWGERQIISREWVARSVAPSQELNPGYGLLWWLIDEPPGYMARGYLDTNLYVFPALELVVVRMQSKRSDMPQGSYPASALRLFGRLIE